MEKREEKEKRKFKMEEDYNLDESESE